MAEILTPKPIVPNSGLAPALINILAMEGARQFDSLDSIHLRVGGLPQNPRPPFFYQVVFSVEGLINEYVERAEVIRDGVHTTVDSMSGLEDIEFPPPFGTLEAFSTSGGLSWLPRIFEGKVRELDYKTIRYRGHCEKFKTLLAMLPGAFAHFPLTREEEGVGIGAGAALAIPWPVGRSAESHRRLRRRQRDSGRCPRTRRAHRGAPAGM